ncbi:phage tail protein [Ancylobacter sp.]|uniref:phage tail protein n=1 Tax=Ancylobacter sp. TaxID=1872567 RepID=UPI003BA88F24
MSEGFFGEIRFFAYKRIPDNWLIADGRLLNVATYQPLFALLGNTYGGDGRSTFALPDLRGRVPIGFGTDKALNVDFNLGKAGGAENVTLTTKQMPRHSHSFNACTMVGTMGNAQNAHVAAYNSDDLPAKNARYAFGTDAASGLTQMNVESIETWGGTSAGTALPHNNMQPFAVMHCCICTYGLWPEQPW